MEDRRDERAEDHAATPQPLDYRGAAHHREPPGDVLERRARRIAVVTGAVISGVAVVAGVFCYILGALRIGAAGPTPAERYHLGFWITAILVTAVGGVTAYQHLVRRRCGFLAGVLLGIGIAALIEGACFVALNR
jgi:hypothetical protein